MQNREMNTVQQLLTQHLDIWTTAETEKKSGRGRTSGNAGGLYGIKKLRELILELAVRGKLVPQDPNDEPASELLKRIQAENAKPNFPISEDDKSCELPNKWQYARLGNLFNITYGKGLSNAELTDEGYEVFGANGIIGKYPKYLYEDPQLLISCRGAYSGKPNISPPKCYVTSNSLVLGNNWKNLDLKYFYYSLSIANKEKIVTGSAQPQVTTTNLEPFVIGLPPLAEQHRIVAKVDELMGLCDKLENQHLNAAEAHEALVSELLATLTRSQNAADFNANWQRIYAHFDVLFTTEASIDALKQTLLQLAVMGKLVPQDPNEEPASELLKRIQTEKAKLIAERKLKKEKALAPISEDEKPFELPQGWEWQRLGDLLTFEYGDNLPEPKRSNTGEYPVFGSNGIVGTHNESFVKTKCIVIGRKGSAGALNLNLHDGCCVTDVAYYCIPPKQLDLFFIFKLLHTLGLDELGKGIKPGLNRNEAYQLLIAIPPLAEQHRIVAKVDALMALCDQLKTRIQQASQQQQLIADALVARAVA